MFTSIHPGASVVEALKLTAENDIGSLVVLEDDKLVGIITERRAWKGANDKARELGWIV